MQKDTIEAIYIIGTLFSLGLVVGVVLMAIAKMSERKSSIKWGYDATNKRWYKIELEPEMED